MQIIVKLVPPDISSEASVKTRGKIPGPLMDMVSSLGLNLQPMHPDVEDENLENYYILEVNDQEQGNHIVKQLLQSPLVDGAYVKPPDALP